MLVLFFIETIVLKSIPTIAPIPVVQAKFIRGPYSIVKNGMDADHVISFKYAFGLFQGNTQRLPANGVNQFFIPDEMKNTVTMSKSLAGC